MNELLNESLKIDERETYISLMPKWLAELDLIEVLTKRKKELEEKVKIATKTIGAYECDIYKISVENKVESKIKSSKSIKEDIDTTLDQLKKIATEKNDTDTLDKIKVLENNLQEDIKISYAKPQNKIKELNSICDNLVKDKTDLMNNIVETTITTEYKLKQLKHLSIKDTLEEDFLETNSNVNNFN